MQISNEEAKLMEISKLQKTVESLSLELDAAKLSTVNEINKNAVLQRQLELSMKERTALEKEEAAITELRNENALLKDIRIFFTAGWILRFDFGFFPSSGGAILFQWQQWQE
ncbi:myosin-15-like isoform X2 [Ipomoea triloba]|uniref:myosin-15-like isoform X2 n=1 Tax=Ipomoea triloba TaxID=35885 RepID=UPI00125CE1FF|nr:myosin-15-like isoform X2 [Ipomoea triloba]